MTEPSKKQRRKRARSGELMAWIKDHADHEDRHACLKWPFSTQPDGRINGMTIKRKTVQPTRIMCELVCGPAPSDVHQAAHSCGKAREACINPRHLRWATPAENEADKRYHGTYRCGELLSSRLSADAVREIFKRVWFGEAPKALSEEFGVNDTTIGKIKHRRIWRSVTQTIETTPEQVARTKAHVFARKCASARNAIFLRYHPYAKNSGPQSSEEGVL